MSIVMMEKPKRPMSAYLLWLNSARAQIKAEHPGLKVTEVAKKAGEMWRAMDDKSTWERRAAQAKTQYTRDLEAFNSNGAPTAPAPKRTNKRANNKHKPKKEKPKEKEISEDEQDDEDDDDNEVDSD